MTMTENAMVPAFAARSGPPARYPAKTPITDAYTKKISRDQSPGLLTKEKRIGQIPENGDRR